MGVAADSWMAFTDRFLTLDDNSAEKINLNRKMLKLIDIYYDALDAPKTGKEIGSRCIVRRLLQKVYDMALEIGEAAAPQLCTFALGVLDKDTQTLKIVPITSNKVVYTLGGVARNVAHCVSMLGTRPYMISVVGHDMPGNLMLEHWKSNGLPVEGIRRGKDIETAVVCNMFDSEGELAAAVASVAAAVPANAKILMFRKHLTS
ncbi:hypothetical protein POM88_023534 [Heracleum sosnowskyi]|uniref:Carbohydrate kinase PfkB domain-containing protein n=1 Tax=Heracleum sosnowskyi TaxID=360622 RepID=A0AAD8IIY7_9APIA|nr:hypothetical protein POM88_023534 [Heracleum sosnowskyi]